MTQKFPKYLPLLRIILSSAYSPKVSCLDTSTDYPQCKKYTSTKQEINFHTARNTHPPNNINESDKGQEQGTGISYNNNTIPPPHIRQTSQSTMNPSNIQDLTHGLDSLSLASNHDRSLHPRQFQLRGRNTLCPKFIFQTDHSKAVQGAVVVLDADVEEGYFWGLRGFG